MVFNNANFCRKIVASSKNRVAQSLLEICDLKLLIYAEGNLKKYIALFLPALMAGILYIPSLGFEYLSYDDPIYVQHNPAIHSAATIQSVYSEFLSIEYIYHPITMLSFKFNALITGVDAFSFRAFNLAIHLCNIVLANLWFQRCKLGRISSLLLALIYGVHPMNQESVAWIAERKGLLSTFFCLACLTCQNPLRSRLTWRASEPVLLWILSILCKPVAIFLPFVLVPTFIEMFRTLKSSSHLKRLLIPATLLTGAIACGLIVGFLCYRAEAAVGSFGDSLIINWPSAIGAIVLYPLRYAGILDYSILHPIGIVGNIHVLSGMMIVAASALTYFASSAIIRINILLFFTSLFPAINLIQIGPHFTADRYFYLPQVFLLCIIGALFLGQRQPQDLQKVSFFEGTTLIAVVAVIIALVILSSSRLQRWRTTESIFTEANEAYPQSARVKAIIGSEMFKSGRIKEASIMLQRANNEDPFDPIVLKKLNIISGLNQQNQNKK